MTTIQTPRLLLRRWRDADVLPMAAINADPEVMRWIGDGTVRDAEQTRAGIEAWERTWVERGFGLFAVEVRSTGDLAGFAGLIQVGILPVVMPAVEIAWRLGRPYWGKGFGTEAARAALRFGLVDCDLDRILALVQVGNGASERIMEKLGMRLERATVDPATARALRVYEISKPRYLLSGEQASSA